MSVTIRRTGLPLDLALANVMTVDDWRAVGEMAKVRIVQRTKRVSRSISMVVWRMLYVVSPSSPSTGKTGAHSCVGYTPMRSISAVMSSVP